MPRKSRKNVGLIGLGIIGSRVANALRSEGWHVYVWNRTPRAAPNFLASPAEVAELCDIIQIFVADAQALFEVLDALADKLTPQHVIVCNATVGPEATVEAAKLVQDRGAKFLDAPFTGSKGAAENRQLVYYIGGDDDTFRKAEPILKVSSKAIVRLGKIGHAATLKVVTNLLGAVTTQVLAEALAVVQSSGIAADALTDALEHHAVRSALTDMKLAKMIHGDYEPHFSMKHMFKDVQLGIHIANALDIDLPATTATAGVMYGALTRGWADLDYAALAKVYQTEEEPAKTELAPVEKAALSAPESSTAKSEPLKHASPDAEPPKEVIAPPKETLSSMVSIPAAAPLSPQEQQLLPQVTETKVEKNETLAAETAPPAPAAKLPEITQKPAETPAVSQPVTPAASMTRPPELLPARPAENTTGSSALTSGDLKALGATLDSPAPPSVPVPAEHAAKQSEAGGELASKLADQKPVEPKERKDEESAKPKVPMNRIRRWFRTGAR